MNIAVKSALASAAIAVVYACATPVDISGDVLLANPNDFGDGGLPGGAAGMGQGGAPSGEAGTGGTDATIGGAGGGTGIAGMPVGLSGSGGLPSGGASGAGTGGTAAGSGGVTSGGSGGAGGAAAGTGGTGAGTGGTAGAGGTGTTAVFDPASCDFTDTTGCDDLTCLAACSTNDGGDCSRRCTAVVACASGEVPDDPNLPCVPSEDDPLCGGRDQGLLRACTNTVESAGGFDPAPPTGAGNPQPSFVARQFVECICSVPRP